MQNKIPFGFIIKKVFIVPSIFIILIGYITYDLIKESSIKKEEAMIAAEISAEQTREAELQEARKSAVKKIIGQIFQILKETGELRIDVENEETGEVETMLVVPKK